MLLFQVTLMEMDDGNGDSSEIIGDLLSEMSGEGSSGGSGSGLGKEFGSGEDEDGDEEDPLEFVEVNTNYYWIAYLLRMSAFVHSVISLAMLVAYYHLKVID